jgi:hypothetical protein
MKNKKNEHGNQQPDRNSYQPSAGKEGEDQHKIPFALLPVKSEKNIPVKADLDNRRSIKNRPHLH